MSIPNNKRTVTVRGPAALAFLAAWSVAFLLALASTLVVPALLIVLIMILLGAIPSPF